MSLAAEATSQAPALVPWPSTTRLWPGPGGQPQSCLVSRDSWCVVAGSWEQEMSELPPANGSHRPVRTKLITSTAFW